MLKYRKHKCNSHCRIYIRFGEKPPVFLFWIFCNWNLTIIFLYISKCIWRKSPNRNWGTTKRKVNKLTAAQKAVGCTKKYPVHSHLAQLMNFVRVEGPFTIDTLVSSQRREAKGLFNLCAEKISSPKNIPFLAFHTIQNKHEGPACHTFLCFLATQVPSQITKEFQTEIQ